MNEPRIYECEDGWAALIVECHERLSEIDPNYKILQIKEKFGGLRYYFTPSESLDQSLVNQMIKIASYCEARSFHICEICGNPGKLNTKLRWHKTLCEKHTEGREVRGE